MSNRQHNIFQNIKDYRLKVRACWLGKTIGGTLGMPFEGKDGPFCLDYYQPIPSEMMPNDDLDLQVLWAYILRKMDCPKVDSRVLAEAWLRHVNFPMDEYGLAIRNLKLGLYPPASGAYDNWFMNGMGAVIRTEIWACLAAGNPSLAAAYAYQDASVDHTKEGLWAAMFFAAMEAAAFVENDLDTLVRVALQQIPTHSQLSEAVQKTLSWWQQTQDWLAVREMILQHYNHPNFTDVTMNLCFMVLALLASGGDFGRSICIATNCGKDTDCTAASVGALMGILNPAGISEQWLRPIGNKLVISKEIVDIQAPKTIDEFTDWICELYEEILPSVDKPIYDEMKVDFAVQPIPISYCFRPTSPSIKETCPNLHRDTQIFYASGQFCRKPKEFFQDNVMMLEYKFKLPYKDAILVGFNANQSYQVWLDDTYLFSRDSGIMLPSPHRMLWHSDQHRYMILDKGIHKATIFIAKPQNENFCEWTFVLADSRTKQWLIVDWVQ